MIDLHKELEDDSHSIGVHRKELGARVDSINKRYLKLFERVMSELLAMQKNKFRFCYLLVVTASGVLMFLPS